MELVILCLAALGSILAVMVLYKHFWNYGLVAQVKFASEQVSEGECFVIQEVVENRKMLPLLTLTVKFQTERDIRYVANENTKRTDRQYRNDCFSVMPYQRIVRSLEVIGDRRGYYSIDEINLVATDLFYRQTLTDCIPNNSWIYICPRRSDYPGFSKVFQRIYGEYLSDAVYQETSFEFKGIRDYTVTDSMRKINWKASARYGSLKVNQFYDTTGQQLTIFLNMEQNGVLKYEDLLEESIRITRNFIEEFVRKGIPVRLISNGVDKLTGQELYVREGAGPAHVDFCLKQLARLQVGQKIRGMAEVLKEQRHRKSNMQEATLLISAEQSARLSEAYTEYVGEGNGAYWLIPIHRDMKEYLRDVSGDENYRARCGKGIHIEYLIMEQMV